MWKTIEKQLKKILFQIKFGNMANLEYPDIAALVTPLYFVERG